MTAPEPTPEERALSIIAEMQDEDGALGFTLSACETAEMADLIAAAIREAEVRGARRMRERAEVVVVERFNAATVAKRTT